MLQRSRFIMTALYSLNCYAAADGGTHSLLLSPTNLVRDFLRLLLCFCCLNHHSHHNVLYLSKKHKYACSPLQLTFLLAIIIMLVVVVEAV